MRKSRWILLLPLVGVLASMSVASGANVNPTAFKDEGAGIYTDASVANQLSSFTINRNMVSCGVGTVDATGGLTGGPFAMLMFAPDPATYRAQDQRGVIRAAGDNMRSITWVAGNELEDVIHSYVAIAVDGDSGLNLGSDRFDIHFKTGFWNTGNPLCTPSTVVAGGCRFGGNLIQDASGQNEMGSVSED